MNVCAKSCRLLLTRPEPGSIHDATVLSVRQYYGEWYLIGEVRKESPMSKSLALHAMQNPPRCISAFRAETISELRGKVPSAEDVAGFEIQCPCGSRAFSILGYSEMNEARSSDTLFIAPLALECSKCHTITELMDPRQDGYDAELDGSTVVTGEGKRVKYQCSDCGAELMSVAVGFEYAIDDEDLDSDERLAERPQDFFTWFWLYSCCKSCGTVQEVSEYECA